MTGNTLVVARYDEDISWIDQVPDDWTVQIVQKQIDGVRGDMPNVGREAASYLWAIQRLYDDLDDADAVAFVQGWPWSHYNQWLTWRAKRDRDPQRPILAFMSELQMPPGFKFFTGIEFCEPDGRPTGRCLHTLGHYYRKWTGQEPPPRYLYSPGAQFIITAQKMHSYPIGKYQEIMDDIVEDPGGPWIAERLWGYLWP